MSDKKYLNIRVIGYDEEIQGFIALIAVIQELGRQGTNRDFKVCVDGDGSGKLKFQLIYGEDNIKDIDFIENFNPNEIPTIYIGE